MLLEKTIQKYAKSLALLEKRMEEETLTIEENKVAENQVEALINEFILLSKHDMGEMLRLDDAVQKLLTK